MASPSRRAPHGSSGRCTRAARHFPVSGASNAIYIPRTAWESRPTFTLCSMECSICLDRMGTTQSRFVGHCGHSFHIGCIEKNVTIGNRATCPLCCVVFDDAPGANDSLLRDVLRQKTDHIYPFLRAFSKQASRRRASSIYTTIVPQEMHGLQYVEMTRMHEGYNKYNLECCIQ